ncbi:MAG: nucleoside deaminase [Alphaproteobacteria bacterium]|nr:nucleoside deaminase [Alphaproteobacteria bacterium]
MTETTEDRDQKFMRLALEQARKSYDASGIPVGAVLVKDGEDAPMASGYNQRVQQKNPILHSEMDCLQNNGRQKSYRGTTIYTTLSPCMMCAGTIVQFKIPSVVIGQKEVPLPADKPFRGNIDFLKSHGVEVRLLNDPGCEALFAEFLENNMDLWLEDIGED